MTEKTSNKNGARGHPLSTDKEIILISQEARTERKARQRANLPDTAFRQAEKADSFAARDDIFSAEAEAERKTMSKMLRDRRSRLKKSYARDVRVELSQDNPTDQRGGIRTKTGGTVSKRHFHSEDSLKKDGAFFVGEKRSGGRKAIRRFSRQRLSSAAENAVISQKEDMFYGSDDYNVSAEAVRKAKAAQKSLIKKAYQRAPESAVYIPIVSRIRERARARSGQATLNGGKSAARKLAEFFEEHPVLLIVILISGMLIMMVSSAVSGGTMLITHTVAPSAIATTYTAEDEDITGAEEDYRALEEELSRKVSNLERYYPGYSLYQLSAAQIGHDPFKLAALLTVMHEDYRREDVKDELQRIFEEQYNLSLHDSLVLPGEGDGTFTAVLKNNGLDYVADKLLTKDEKERYDLLVETKGNKPDLFADDIYANNGAGWFDYSIAGDALSDQKFANMMAEAKKYLGYPYVWGGSSPATSFDCSGFVCWVINHSGNGWNVGRTTANGLCNMLPKVSPSEAWPGDIIFFQGTYATTGASHVGIYLGNGMMIHCGTPIQYASINTPYWQQHFYCFGRLPSN